MYKYIIWDFGGTLFNTYPASTAALKKALLEQGVEALPEEILEYLRISRKTALKYYCEKYCLNTSLKDCFSLYESKLLDKLAPYPFVKDICEAILEKNGQNFIYSHRECEKIIELLKLTEMEKYFAAIISANDGIRRKPAPDGFIHIIDSFSLDSAFTLAVGDRPLDIQAAANAGIDSCYFNEEGKRDPNAKYCIASFRELQNILF